MPYSVYGNILFTNFKFFTLPDKLPNVHYMYNVPPEGLCYFLYVCVHIFITCIMGLLGTPWI